MATPIPSLPVAPPVPVPAVGPPFRRILATTDLSPATDNALRVAAAFARFFDADLRLVFVLTEAEHQAMMSASSADFHTTVLPADGRDREHQRRSEAQAALERLRADPALSGVNFSVEVVESPVVDGIIAAAAGFNADLLVMGTHARHGLDRLWWGSVAETVLHLSSCPVLAVSPDAVVPSRVDSVLLATSLGPGAHRAARYAAAIARDRNAILSLMQVVHDEAPPDPTAIDHALEGRLAGLLPNDLVPKPHLHVRITAGRPAQEILRAVRDLHPDVLVIGAEHNSAHPRWQQFATHLPWPLLHHILGEVTCPVLAVPASLVPQPPLTPQPKATPDGSADRKVQSIR